ncbi:MAG: 23S rRNA (adenine(2503)-C(2))-methyltransferase RlmN [Sedimentisphaerales bacterium]|nr:23S rRNA (adenine(2503)-C(2))-methyltransferase RlmN [Sedimentisphaerales bacterium]
MNIDLKDKTLDELEQLVVELGQRKYLAKYIFQFIHTQNVSDIEEITPLSKAFRQKLTEEGYFISEIEILEKQVDKDKTAKYLFKLGDGERIESVLLHDGKRKTLCVSTQAGCNMNCAFCATGKLKFKRNLSAGEIADQVNTVEADSGKISNVVYMGMGEPLLNYEAVMKSVEILNHEEGKNIGIRHITISTCGIIPKIEMLANEKLRPRLAISLNAPENALRSQIMPINNKYPLDKLIKTIKNYQEQTNQRVTFEYVMIKGLNDSHKHAQMLIKLVRNISCNVNLIEYNPNSECDYKGSNSTVIKEFASILSEAGIETVIRFRMGREINAACGQLGADWLKKLKE